jgi:cytochrome c oxidase assembly protein subunit 15
METPWLHRYTVLLAVCTLFLVVAGAAVTSNEAGLSVPDWPLSYGSLMPAMIGGVRFEHGHRLIATAVGLLTIGLVVWLFRSGPAVPAYVKKLGIVALAGVIVQGVLGGLTVLWLLPPPVSIAHACLAQVFFSITVALALFTSKSWGAETEPVEDHGWPSLRSLAVVTPALVLVQIALGAAFRHRAMGILPHILGAMMVVFALVIVGAFVLHQFPTHRPLRRAAAWMMAMAGVQVFLGIVAFMARLGENAQSAAMLPSTVAHVAGGGLTLASTTMLSILIRRHVRARASNTAGGEQAVVGS